MTKAKDKMKAADSHSKASNQRHKRKSDPVVIDLDELAAIEEDCDREIYGDDYDHLKVSGWLDR